MTPRESSAGRASDADAFRARRELVDVGPSIAADLRRIGIDRGVVQPSKPNVPSAEVAPWRARYAFRSSFFLVFALLM